MMMQFLSRDSNWMKDYENQVMEQYRAELEYYGQYESFMAPLLTKKLMLFFPLGPLQRKWFVLLSLLMISGGIL